MNLTYQEQCEAAIKRRQKINEFLKENKNKSFTKIQLMEMFGLSPSTLISDFKKLQKQDSHTQAILTSRGSAVGYGWFEEANTTFLSKILGFNPNNIPNEKEWEKIKVLIIDLTEERSHYRKLANRYKKLSGVPGRVK